MQYQNSIYPDEDAVPWTDQPSFNMPQNMEQSIKQLPAKLTSGVHGGSQFYFISISSEGYK